MDAEYISLQRYFRNTPSDTEVHAEHQLRVAKNIQNHAELGRTKEQGGKQSVSRTGPALCGWGN